MIEREIVSSPIRPPRYHPFFTVINDQDQRLFTRPFRTAYAAHHYLTTIFTACTDRGCTVNWRSSSEVVFTDPETQCKLVIKENHLEDLIEYTPTKEENKWTPPDSAQLNKVSQFWISSYHTPPDEKPKTQPAPNRHKTVKAPQSPDQITVAQLAQKANIPANKARQILRKAGFTKPPIGWTYQKDDPIIETIRDLFTSSS